MFIMNLNVLALKAMAIGKFAILLIVVNMIRSWSQNAQSTTVGGNMGGVIIVIVFRGGVIRVENVRGWGIANI